MGKRSFVITVAAVSIAVMAVSCSFGGGGKGKTGMTNEKSIPQSKELHSEQDKLIANLKLGASSAYSGFLNDVYAVKNAGGVDASLDAADKYIAHEKVNGVDGVYDNSLSETIDIFEENLPFLKKIYTKELTDKQKLAIYVSTASYADSVNKDNISVEIGVNAVDITPNGDAVIDLSKAVYKKHDINAGKIITSSDPASKINKTLRLINGDWNLLISESDIKTSMEEVFDEYQEDGQQSGGKPQSGGRQSGSKPQSGGRQSGR